ncbi:MAG: hypothetical protein HN580_13450 [Deltaproteobacteria bacterium]|nr:hypothetical protein [Deltaproteobacteria bacterium]MBT7712330.1 hypothetical protein [Deltaproteobacteria bacterium]MBT7890022.1 hypothetical protein [Deltaproteobacteria bacterium]
MQSKEAIYLTINNIVKLMRQESTQKKVILSLTEKTTQDGSSIDRIRQPATDIHETRPIQRKEPPGPRSRSPVRNNRYGTDPPPDLKMYDQKSPGGSSDISAVKFYFHTEGIKYIFPPPTSFDFLFWFFPCFFCRPLQHTNSF